MCSIQRIEGVVVKRRWCPAFLCMATRTVGREIGCCVVRIRSCVVVIQVASDTGIRRIVVIAVVAAGTIVGDGDVSAIQLIIIIVNLESCGLPTWLSGVATCTVRR